MRATVLLLSAAAMLLPACGCEKPLLEPQKPRTIEVPPYLTDTIGQRAVIGGLELIDVHGVGLVTGLNGTGSSVYPQGLRDRMLKELARHRVEGREAILADPNNAVVLVNGYVPAGSRAGEAFDLLVLAAPATQTTSLEGGTLLMVELARLGPARVGLARGPVLADGRGELFVSPFVLEDRPAPGPANLRPVAPGEERPPAAPAAEPARQSDPRVARILGGGACRQDRGFFLQLLEPSQRTVEQVVRHINARFPDAAKGKVELGLINLKVPGTFVDEKRHFLEVISAIYLIDSPDQRERRMRDLVAELRAGRDPSQVTAALEAFGPPVAALLEPLLAEANGGVRFHAAWTLARLGRANVVPSLEKFVRDDASPYQEQAVHALGELRGAGAAVIFEALEAKSPKVRIAAYLMLRRVAPSMLRIAPVPGRVELGLAPSRAEPFIYVSRRLEPRIVIFGQARVRPPLLVDTPRYLVSVAEGGQRLTIMNKRYGPTCRLETGLDVAEVVAAMAGPLAPAQDDTRPRALDLSYCDLVGFLDQASKKGALSAPLVFEPLEIVAPAAEFPATPGGPETDIVIPNR